ncbi:MAG: hypothetical protein ABI543_00220 [Ignavibacteria bacterium]
MEPINGISIEKYAELCAKMNAVLKDNEACAKIAESEGITRENWNAAHEGWQYRMTDPSDVGKTAARFVPLWQKAVDKIKLNNINKHD